MKVLQRIYLLSPTSRVGEAKLQTLVPCSFDKIACEACYKYLFYCHYVISPKSPLINRIYSSIDRVFYLENTN